MTEKEKNPEHIFGVRLPKSLIKKIGIEAIKKDMKIKDFVKVVFEEYFKK